MRPDPNTPATRQVVDLLGYGSPRWISNVLTVLLSGFVVAAIIRNLFQVTMVLLCPLLLRTSQNLRALGEAPENGPARLIGICLVPITNLFLP